MEEVVDGIVHWAVVHPNTGMPAHSHYLTDTGALVDPMVPPEGLGWFDRLGAPQCVLLTNRHHPRDAERFAEIYECPILCHPEGLYEFADGPAVDRCRRATSPRPASWSTRSA